MLKYICIFFIIFLSYTHYIYGEDTIPPTAKLLYPKRLTIFTGNTIKICVDPKKEENGIKEVCFYASYKQYNLSKIKNGYNRNKKLIGKVSGPPYEVVWNCSDIPDQDIFGTILSCDIEDSLGNVKKDAFNHKKVLVIDRNKELSEAIFLCKEIKTPIVIDGKLKEWKQQDSINYTNGNNNLVCYSGWDNENLYLAIKISDTYLYSEGLEKTDWLPCQNDAIEIFFDTKHNHNSLPEKDDKKIMISVVGKHYFGYRDFSTKNINFKLDDIQKLYVKVNGTLNNQTDIDSGYVIELAIPWARLGKKPKNNTSIGFDIVNSDEETRTGSLTVMSWAGNEANNINNPSEWGNLVLVQEPTFLSKNRFVLLFILILCAGLIIFFIKRKKRPAKIKPVCQLTRQEELVKNAKKHILENYQDCSLDRNKLAKNINISSVYLGELFKKTTNKTLPQYINELRIEKAKELLKNSNDSIEQISYNIGFNSPNYFSKVFKNLTGITPKEFRKQTDNPTIV